MSKATSKVLCVRLGVLNWLRFERRCAMVLHERSPRYSHGVPDVLGVTQSSRIIEVEIKIAMGDFRRDSQKWQRRFAMLPHLFYYAVPDVLAPRVENELPVWAGLLSVDKVTACRVIREAPVNKDAPKLTESEWRRAVNQQANCIVSLTRQLWKANSTFGLEKI